MRVEKRGRRNKNWHSQLAEVSALKPLPVLISNEEDAGELSTLNLTEKVSSMDSSSSRDQQVAND